MPEKDHSAAEFLRKMRIAQGLAIATLLLFAWGLMIWARLVHSGPGSPPTAFLLLAILTPQIAMRWATAYREACHASRVEAQPDSTGLTVPLRSARESEVYPWDGRMWGRLASGSLAVIGLVGFGYTLALASQDGAGSGALALLSQCLTILALAATPWPRNLYRPAELVADDSGIRAYAGYGLVVYDYPWSQIRDYYWRDRGMRSILFFHAKCGPRGESYPIPQLYSIEFESLPPSAKQDLEAVLQRHIAADPVCVAKEPA